MKSKSEVRGLLIERTAALFRSESYERKLIAALEGIECSAETYLAFVEAAGIGEDVYDYDLGRALIALDAMYEEAGR